MPAGNAAGNVPGIAEGTDGGTAVGGVDGTAEVGFVLVAGTVARTFDRGKWAAFEASTATAR